MSAVVVDRNSHEVDVMTTMLEQPPRRRRPLAETPEEFLERRAVKRRSGALEGLADAIDESATLAVPPPVLRIEPRGFGLPPKLSDVNAGLVTFFRVLRDRPDELERALRLTPYARDEFKDCVRTWEQVEDDLERARRWYVRCRQAFAGSAATVGWGYEVSGVQRGGTRASSFATSVEQLERFAERFRRVQVDHLDWRKVLERYDGPRSCFYLDPPYHPATRGERGLRRNAAYVHELSADDHEDLVAAAIELRGTVLLSGYDHDAYAPLLEAGFERFTFAHNATASRVLSGRGPRLEVLWRRLEAGVHHAERLWPGEDVEPSVASIDDDGQIPGQTTIEAALEEVERASGGGA